MNFRLWVTTSILALASLLSLPARADDTDIYVSNADATGGTAYVMFSIDFRSDLNSSDNTGYALFSAYHQNASDASLYTALRLAAVAQGASGWSLFDTIRFGLQAVLTKYKDNGLYIGLMFNHNQDNNCAGPSQSGCSNGGEILMGFQKVQSSDGYAALIAFLNRLSYLKSQKTQSNMADHPYQGAELFFEFFRYLTGQHIYNEHNGWTDFEQGNSKDTSTDTNECSIKGSYGNSCQYDGQNGASNPGYAGTWDPAIEDSSSPTHKFISPLAAGAACAKIFTINFMFQVSQQESDSITAMSAATTSEGVGSSVSNGGQNNYFPNILSILYQSDLANGTTFNTSLNISGTQNVTSYFFVPTTKINTTTTGYASSGGTSTPYPLDTGNASGLTDNLDKIFADILSVSTTFVAAAIPANVFNRSQSLDRLYIALFEAASTNGTVLPFWNGDLKKLKLVNGVVRDANANNAVNAVDGRIAKNALTYWTNSSTLDTTCFGTGTGCSTTDATGYVDTDATSTTDGRQVNRGGAGQNIPGYHTGQSSDPTSTSSPEWSNSTTNARKVLYDPASFTNSAAGTAMLPLNVNNSTTGASEVALCKPTVLGVTGPSDTNCEKLLMFMRGIDPTTAYSAGTHPPSRKWMMSDPLHSRPLGVNYGAATVGGSTYTSTNPAIFIAVSGNDGQLHYIQDTDNSGTQLGKELWSFIPQAAMGLNPQGQYLQSTLMTNVAGTAHSYGLDGATAAYIKDVNGNGTIDSGDTVTLFVGMRRGGYSYYALDVTDPTTPKIKWRIDNTMSDFTELGMTFSTPKIGFLNHNGTKRAVVFFTGGFDTNKDTDGMGTNDTKGRAIYAVRADNGDLIWKAVYDASKTGVGGVQTGGTASKASYGRADLLNSIPSDVTLLDSNNDGYTDRLIVGDTAGNLWRADFAGSDATKWTLTLVAKLGRLGTASTATKVDDRRLFYPPEVVQTSTASSGGTNYDAYLVGTGDREDPLDKGSTTSNYFFSIRDFRTGALSTDGSVASSTTAADMTCGGHACTAGSAITGSTDTGDFTDVTDDCLQSEGTTAAQQLSAQTTCNEIISYGWKVKLDHTPSAEKSLSSPLAVSGVVFFTSYVPPGSGANATSCGPAEGTGFQYALNILDGTAAFNFNTADGACTTGAGCNTGSGTSGGTGAGGTAGMGNTKDDRTTTLATNFGGIAAQDVLINNTPGVTQSGCDCLFQPGLTCQCVNATRSGRTFWQRLEQVPQ